MPGNKFLIRTCYLALGFLGLYLAGFQSILGRIALDYSLTKVAMGSVVTSHFVGFFVGPLIAGELSDKYGRKVIIFNAFLAFLAGLLVILVSVNIFQLIIGAFLIGFGFGIIEGSLTALLTDIMPQNTNRVINLSQVFFGSGAVMGPFIVMAITLWKMIYVISIMIVLVFLYVFQKYTYPDYKITERAEGIIIFKLLKHKIFLLLCISMIMYVGIEEGIAFWITTYTKEWVTSGALAGILLSIFWGSIILGRYIMSKFSDHLNEIIIINAALSVLFLALSLFSNQLWFNIAIFFGIGFGFSGIWPMIMALTKMYFSKYSGTAFGIMMSCCAVGGIFIPLAMGYVGEIFNLKWALLLCLVPLGVIIACHFKIKQLRFINNSN